MASTRKISDAVVIGGGLAGTAVAEALQRRGLRPSLIERHPLLAQEASGQALGLAHPILHRQATAKMRLSILAFSYLRKHLQKKRLEGSKKLRSSLQWKECGVLQLAYKESLKERFSRGLKILETNFQSEKIEASLVEDGKQSRDICGFLCDTGGLYFPRALQIKMQALCEAQVSHPEIELIFNQRALSIEYAKKEGLWKVHTEDQKNLLQSPYLILACARETAQLLSLGGLQLPLRSVRGQSFLWPDCPMSERLACAVSYDGYAIPHLDKPGVCLIGASFEEWNQAREVNPEQNLELYAKLLERIPGLSLEGSMPGAESGEVQRHLRKLNTRVAFRCASPDRLPLCGPLHALGEEREGENSVRGLYLSAAYGSHGLLFTPLGAELIASKICQEESPFPLEENDIEKAISPLRYAKPK